ELGEVQLPYLVRPGGFLRECRLAPLGELASFALVGGGKDQSLVAQHAQDGRLRAGDPLVADHRPDLPVAPRGMREGVSPSGLPHALPGRPGPGAPGLLAGALAGLAAPPGPFGHADDLAEPRGRYARVAADHLEVLEGPRCPSVLFFQTRASR